MAAWGLLKGLGEGLSFSGAQMVKTQEEIAKEARLEKYRQARVADERQYQEGQAKETIARSVSETRDGELIEFDMNAKGEKIGTERNKGAAPVSRDHLIPISRNGGLYDAAQGKMVYAPAGGSAAKAPKTATITDADGNKVTAERQPDGSWKPITLEGEKASGPRGAFHPPSKNQVTSAREFIKSMSKESELRDLEPEEQQAIAAARQVVQDSFDTPKPGTERNPLIGVTVEDLPRLRPGTVFVDPEGNLRRVPDRQEAAPAAPAGAAPPVASTPVAAPGLLKPPVPSASGMIERTPPKPQGRAADLSNVPTAQLRKMLAGKLSAAEKIAVTKELAGRN